MEKGSMSTSNEAYSNLNGESSKLSCSSDQLPNLNNDFLPSQHDSSSIETDIIRENQKSSEIYKIKCNSNEDELINEESHLCYDVDQYDHMSHIEHSSADEKIQTVDCKSLGNEAVNEEEIIKLNEDVQLGQFSNSSMSTNEYSQNENDLVSSSVVLSTVLPTSTSIENSEIEREFLEGPSNSQRYTISLSENDSIHPDNRSRAGALYQLSEVNIDQLSANRDSDLADVSMSLNSGRFISPDLLDPALLRLIDHRLTTVFGSSLSSLPPGQKESLLETVVRNMVGIVGNRIYTTDGNVIETKIESSNPNRDISSTAYTANDLQMDRMYSEATGIMETLANENNRNVESSLEECASSSLLNIEDVPLEVISSSGATRSVVLHQAPLTGRESSKVTDSTNHSTITASLIVNSNNGPSSSDELIEVPVTEVNSSSRLLNFVSSSTGLEHEIVCLDNESVMLNSDVDAVIISSESASGDEKKLRLVHNVSQPFSIDLNAEDENTLRFSDIDSNRFSTEVHIQEMDTEQNVSSTVNISNGVTLMEASQGGDIITTTSIDIPLTLVQHINTPLHCSSMTSDDVITIPDNKQIVLHSRPKRNANKSRLSKNSPDSADVGKWCEDCNSSYMSGCTKHRVQLISDKPVLTRARASLPANYLSISKAFPNENSYGVFAKKMILKRTQFGPVEGIQCKELQDVSKPSNFLILLETEDNKLVNIDTSDESQSNWMGFVRQAQNYKEQNLVIIQQGPSLFFTTTRTIMPKTELKVGYSVQYAARRGLIVLEPDKEEKDEEENSWPCFECNKTFSTSEELQHHLNEHDGLDAPEAITLFEEKSKPTTTRKNGKTKSKAVKKGKTNSGSKKNKKPGSGGDTFRCDKCPKTFPRQYSLQRHQSMHNGEKKFKCSVCEMRFTHVYNRNRHMRRHRTQPPLAESIAKKPIKTLFKKRQVGGCEWECTHCNLTFDNPSLLNLHTLTHAAEDVGLDEFNIDSMINNKEHEFDDNGYELSDIITGENFQCPQCTQSFHTKKELIEHASTHGKVLQKKSYRGVVNPAKPFKCDLCYKAFAAEDRLQRHMMVHGSEDEKPLQCHYCEKRFLNNSALACHVKVHSDEKKIFECPICKEEFDQVVLLKGHIRIHSISGYFTCPHCQKPFDEYNQIRKHIRIFHSDKKFPCDHCDKVFPRPDKLKLHMLRHSTHREFLCASCGKQFKRKDKLKEHMKRMHSMEREARLAQKPQKTPSLKKFIPKVLPTDYHRFIYKCHSCLLGFKRRGMLVNHLAKRHPDIRPETVPELNLPILKTTRDYYCQYCEKIYKSSSKRKAHIMKQHPGAELPMSNRRKGGIPEIPGMPNPTYSQTVGSVTTLPHNCEWCHKQYASKAKLLQHQRKKHVNLLPEAQQIPRSHHRDLLKGDCQQIYVHEQITVTTQTSDIEFSDSVTNDMKSKTEVTEIYVDQDEVHTTVVVESEEKVNQSSSDQMPPADLLTQAMSELTQSLNLNEYVSNEFNLTRAQQSCSTVFPSTTVASQSTLEPAVSNSSEVAIDQSQLGQLLGHYNGKIEPNSNAEGVTISESFIQQSWARSDFADYSEQ